MAEVFNEYFATVFTNEVGGCIPEVSTVSDGIELSNILVTEDIIRKKLMSISVLIKLRELMNWFLGFWQLSQRR